MKHLLKVGLLASTLAFSVAAFGTSAVASTVACSAPIAAKVTNTSACEVSISAKQDFLNTDPLVVNSEDFFGIDTWSFIRKDDPPVAGTQSGTWSLLASDWDMYDTIMLIFKSGNGTFLTGYLAVADAISGNWSSPFVGVGPRGQVQIKNVSHISYYGRLCDKGDCDGGDDQNPDPVPLPAGGLLLLGGLAALAGLKRRKA